MILNGRMAEMCQPRSAPGTESAEEKSYWPDAQHGFYRPLSRRLITLKGAGIKSSVFRNWAA